MLVPKHDAEDLEVHQGFDLLRNAAEKLFPVEDGTQLAADFVEQAQSIEELIRAGIERRTDGVGLPD